MAVHFHTEVVRRMHAEKEFADWYRNHNDADKNVGNRIG